MVEIVPVVIGMRRQTDPIWVQTDRKIAPVRLMSDDMWSLVFDFEFTLLDERLRRRELEKGRT